jgi:hypothetical protein
MAVPSIGETLPFHQLLPTGVSLPISDPMHVVVPLYVMSPCRRRDGRCEGPFVVDPLMVPISRQV